MKVIVNSKENMTYIDENRSVDPNFIREYVASKDIMINHVKFKKGVPVKISAGLGDYIVKKSEGIVKLYEPEEEKAKDIENVKKELEELKKEISKSKKKQEKSD